MSNNIGSYICLVLVLKFIYFSIFALSLFYKPVNITILDTFRLMSKKYIDEY